MATARQAQVTPVLNNRESMIQIQLPPRRSDHGITPGAIINLLPGMNFVETEKWEEAKKNTTCQALLKEKIAPSRAPEQNPERVNHVILEEGTPVGKDNPLASVSAPTAVVMVGEMFDVHTMKRFLEQEDRPEVAAALKAQIKKIEKPEGVKKAG